MAKVVIRDIDPRVDGEYPLASVDDWSYEEWHQVKKVTGLVLGDFLNADDEALTDTGVILALAMVACERAGIQKAYLMLKHGRLDNIELVPDEEEAEQEEEQNPPEQPSTDSEPDSDDSTSSDGGNVRTLSALSANDHRSTGDPISPTGFPRSEQSA